MFTGKAIGKGIDNIFRYSEQGQIVVDKINAGGERVNSTLKKVDDFVENGKNLPKKVSEFGNRANSMFTFCKGMTVLAVSGAIGIGLVTIGANCSSVCENINAEIARCLALALAASGVGVMILSCVC